MRATVAAAAGLLLMAGCSATPATGEPAQLEWELVRTLPHDPASFTQGLEFVGDDLLAESSGRYGESRVSLVRASTGEVLQSAWLPDEHFGEGLTLLGDTLLQLTWQEGVVHAWRVEDLSPAGSLSIDGEGWGLCHDGEQLWRSDGSSQLMSHSPETFEVSSTVGVTHDGEPLDRLNELECAEDGRVWANVWQTDEIVLIDPVSGRVEARVDAAPLRDRLPAGADVDVLNGIARIPGTDRFLVTGKYWPTLFEVRFVE